MEDIFSKLSFREDHNLGEYYENLLFEHFHIPQGPRLEASLVFENGISVRIEKGALVDPLFCDISVMTGFNSRKGIKKWKFVFEDRKQANAFLNKLKCA